MWENYNMVGQMIEDGTLEKGQFEKQIMAFSGFLSETNSEFVYNKTYLPCYIEGFWDFLQAFHRKYFFVTEVFKMAEKYSDISLRIDRYWQQETSYEEGNPKLNINKDVYWGHGNSRVMDETILIECSVLRGVERFIFQRKIEDNREERNQAKQQLEDFFKLYKEEAKEKVQK